MTAPAATHGMHPDQYSCLPELEGMTGVELSACKRAEDGDGWIVRLVEHHGGCGTVRFLIPDQFNTVQETDLLEVEKADSGLKIAQGHATLDMNPFQIRTLKLS